MWGEPWTRNLIPLGFCEPQDRYFSSTTQLPKAILTCVEDNTESRHGRIVWRRHNDAVCGPLLWDAPLVVEARDPLKQRYRQ